MKSGLKRKILKTPVRTPAILAALGPTGFDKASYFIVFKIFYFVQLSHMPPIMPPDEFI
ncbi:hypothetical protein XNA1_3530004 [Xenorhabdus nematophila str. Anatoliense]|nr:hypothetical protein XNA1_3530004 [Xenorhabdus nematophila str. Anatoliense]